MCIEPGICRALFIFRTPVTAKGDDGHQRMRGLDALGDFISGDSRKADIEQHQIRLEPLDLFKPPITRGCRSPSCALLSCMFRLRNRRLGSDPHEAKELTRVDLETRKVIRLRVTYTKCCETVKVRITRSVSVSYANTKWYFGVLPRNCPITRLPDCTLHRAPISAAHRGCSEANAETHRHELPFVVLRRDALIAHFHKERCASWHGHLATEPRIPRGAPSSRA